MKNFSGDRQLQLDFTDKSIQKYSSDFLRETVDHFQKKYPGNIPVILHYQDSNQTIQAQRIFVQKSEEMQEKLAGISLKTVFR